MAEFKDLLGATITKIEGAEVGSERITFETDRGNFLMWYEQDCCAYCRVYQIDGDLVDVIGSPLLLADEASTDATAADSDSATWTFYRLATVKGYYNLRWLGESNGCYSESVSFATLAH